MKWIKGDILYGRKNSDAKHPIIFLEGYDDSYFIGVMITSSERFDDNLPMSKEHFCEFNEKMWEYEIQFKCTYLVDAKLLKRLDWLPFRKVGELTPRGLSFIESVITDKYPKVWEEYLKK